MKEGSFTHTPTDDIENSFDYTTNKQSGRHSSNLSGIGFGGPIRFATPSAANTSYYGSSNMEGDFVSQFGKESI